MAVIVQFDSIFPLIFIFFDIFVLYLCCFTFLRISTKLLGVYLLDIIIISRVIFFPFSFLSFSITCIEDGDEEMWRQTLTTWVF